MSDSKPVRAHLHNAIQSSIALGEELPEGTALKGWVVIAEWVDPDGSNWLSQLNGGASGSSLPTWQTDGYLHNALFSPSEFVPDEEN